MGGGMDWDFGARGRDVVGPKNFSPLTSLEFAIIWMHAQTTNLPK
jgi:hypothetical protein